MILSNIRYLVGLHLADKGLPPTVLAPVLNILNMVDTHLSTCGIKMPPEILKEEDRLAHALVLMNAEETDYDEDVDETEDDDDVEEESELDSFDDDDEDDDGEGEEDL